jgi:hypothetical protein
MWGPPNLLFIEYGVSFLGVKHPRREVDKSPPTCKSKKRKAIPVTGHGGL